MVRTYTKAKRAENEALTRERLTEAALALHTEIGPARTTISMIAERAGVQRHTVYAHFPDERAILMAYSGMHLARDPMPSPQFWEAINDPGSRLKKALGALYGWYAANEPLLAAVFRDAEHHALLREVMGMQFGPVFGAVAESLARGLDERSHAPLHLAMSFYTWRTLTREAGMKPQAAVELMVRTVLDAGAAPAA